MRPRCGAAGADTDAAAVAAAGAATVYRQFHD